MYLKVLSAHDSGTSEATPGRKAVEDNISPGNLSYQDPDVPITDASRSVLYSKVVPEEFSAIVARHITRKRHVSALHSYHIE